MADCVVSTDLVVVVEDLRREAAGVVSLILANPDGGPMPVWDPGAHVDVHLPNGVVRQYSLCGDPAERRFWRIAVLHERESRGGSRYIHEELECGDRLSVSLPRNHFPLVDAREYFFVAGGIGITPILTMARAVGASRPWKLLYGGRSRASMAFIDELRELGGEVVVQPQDEAGLPDLAGFLEDVGDGCAVYCCGPAGLIGALEAAADAWPPATLHVERFRAETAAGAESGSDHGFVVQLVKTGREVDVAPGQSIVDALAAVGVRVTTSCQEGVCGTCETTVLEGEPDHRDSVLNAEERAANTTMMVCCSRATGPRLVLDL